MNKLVLITLVALFSTALAANYAVLVAGSNGYSNYRHQSDVCHAYQTLLQKGYLASNIIVFSYNDVANSKENPYKGQLFNKPSGKLPGVDVNAGCIIDYEGEDVTPENYLAVLTNNKTAIQGGNGRTLESGADDHVFLSFFDHGAPGLIAFPSSYLYADDLIAAFQTMYANKQYSQLVYYLEACESGSMFQNLPTNLNLYAVSAANPTQSSYAAYCGLQAIVGGKRIKSCLGDLFSVNWLEDTDALTDLSSQTLQQQYTQVAKQTTGSQVMQWGDVSFTSEPIGEFLSGETNTSTVQNSLKKLFNFKSASVVSDNDLAVDETDKGIMDSRYTTIQYLVDQFTSAPTANNYNELHSELSLVEKIQRKFTQIAEKYALTGSSNALNTNFDCYSNAISHFENSCGRIPDSQLSNLKYLYDFCAQPQFEHINIDKFINVIC